MECFARPRREVEIVFAARTIKGSSFVSQTRLHSRSIRDMEIVKQLSLFIANKPGTLAAVCDALAKAKINIAALTISDAVDHAVVRMVVSDARRALVLFEEHGVLVIESDVLMIDGDNRPGRLQEIAAALSRKKINIDYAYCATSPKSKRGILILHASNPKKALGLLKKGSK
jgi:hypothetical protein